jgi:glycosyltransferase involved in cell wall biosynthesis
MADARRRGTGRRARHLVIYNGIDASRPAPDRIPPARPTIGFIGRLEREKNPQALGPAAALLARQFPDLEVLVVGGGALEADPRRQGAAAGLQRHFRLVGDQQDVAPWYGRIHLLANTSISEGCCNVILEAMRAAVPVVATAVGGNVETVAEGRTGLLAAPGDPAALAAACDRLLAEPATAAAMGIAGRARLEADFSLPAMTAAYLDLYRSLLG